MSDQSPAAFARPQSTDPEEFHNLEIYHAQEGMTLRDYFMAHCPITWDQAQDYNTGGEDEMAFFCKLRVEYANAMLKERTR